MSKSSVLFENLEKSGRLKKDVPLSLHTTFKVGGNAQYFYEALTREDLAYVINIAQELSLKFFVLGGGSNVLFSDKGFDGIVIKNKTDKIKIVGFKGNISHLQKNVTTVFVESDSGVYLNRLVRFCLDEGLGGLENFLGQPGSIGGAVYMNSHNMNKKDFFGDHVYQAEITDSHGQRLIKDNIYFKFGYDNSKIQKTHDVVLAVTLKLKKGDKNILWQRANEALYHRQKSQPSGAHSAGCIFRNITESEARRISTPQFTKSAGFLLERAGLKGKSVGGAQISQVHANFIINTGGATASDVLELIALAKNKVYERFKVALIEEIVYG